MAPVPPSRAAGAPVIGVLGGVASGKSTVARLFGELGCTVVDADEIAREVSERPEIVEEVRRSFGPKALGGDGRLDRRRLADLVFGDRSARKALEAIVHPPVRAEIERRIARAKADGRAVVLDVPLLLEGGLIRQCDHVVFVEAAYEVRVQRALERGWTEEELRRRERAQADIGVKQREAAHIIRAHTIEDTRRQVRDICSQLLP